MQRGIPFDIMLPATKPVGISGLTGDELDAELEKGFTDLTERNVKSAESAFSETIPHEKVTGRL